MKVFNYIRSHARIQKANGCRIFQRRPDNIYPPIAVADGTRPESTSKVQSVASRLTGPSNASENYYFSAKSVSSSMQRARNAVVLLDEAGKVLRSFGSPSEAVVALALTLQAVSKALQGSHISCVRPLSSLIICFYEDLILELISPKHVCAFFVLCSCHIHLDQRYSCYLIGFTSNCRLVVHILQLPSSMLGRSQSLQRR